MGGSSLQALCPRSTQRHRYRPMDDPIGGHPTRAEQLDLMVSVIAATAAPNDLIVDLGCGTGYLCHLLFEKRSDLRYLGVDVKEEALVEARERFVSPGGRAQFVQGDLDELGAIALPAEMKAGGGARFVVTVLTFHDLANDQKPQVLRWMIDQLAEDTDEQTSYLLLYDRLQLEAETLFPLQTAVWDRIESIHGRPMRYSFSLCFWWVWVWG